MSPSSIGYSSTTRREQRWHLLAWVLDVVLEIQPIGVIKDLPLDVWPNLAAFGTSPQQLEIELYEKIIHEDLQQSPLYITLSIFLAGNLYYRSDIAAFDNGVDLGARQDIVADDGCLTKCEAEEVELHSQIFIVFSCHWLLIHIVISRKIHAY